MFKKSKNSKRLNHESTGTLFETQGEPSLSGQRSVIGDDAETIIRQARRRRRAKLVIELAELFDRLQASFEETLRIKWEIGVRLQRQMAEEEYGDKVTFVVEISAALSRSRTSVYDCLRLAERWPNFDALVGTVRAHIDERLSNVSDESDKPAAKAKMKTWRYFTHKLLPSKKVPRGGAAMTCALSHVPGHVCDGDVRLVPVCGALLTTSLGRQVAA